MGANSSSGKQPVTRTVSGDYVNSMLKIAAERGVDCQTLLRDVGIDQYQVDRNEPVPVELYGSLYQNIANQLSQEWFGMLSGDAVPRGAIRYMGILAVHCPNLETAVLRCQDFFEICRGFRIKQTMRRENDEAVFRIEKLSTVSSAEFDQLIRSTSPDVIKATMTVMHGFAEWLVSEQIPIKRMHFTFSRPEDEPLHSRPYPVIYNADFCGYAIDSAHLSSVVTQSEATAETFANQAPYFTFIKDHLKADSVAEQVRTALMKSNSGVNPTAGRIAEALNISVTSLHRKLAAEDVSYQQVKDEFRLENTLYHLSQPGIKTSDVATLLGFESPSAFYRSFKKWTGMTLQEYRASLQESDIAR